MTDLAKTEVVLTSIRQTRSSIRSSIRKTRALKTLQRNIKFAAPVFGVRSTRKNPRNQVEGNTNKKQLLKHVSVQESNLEMFVPSDPSASADTKVFSNSKKIQLKDSYVQTDLQTLVDGETQTYSVSARDCETQTDLELECPKESDFHPTDFLETVIGESETVQHRNQLFLEQRNVLFYPPNASVGEMCTEADIIRLLNYFPRNLVIINVEKTTENKLRIKGHFPPWHNLERNFYLAAVKNCLEVHHKKYPAIGFDNSIFKAYDNGSAIQFFQDGRFEFHGVKNLTNLTNNIISLIQITNAIDFTAQKISQSVYDRAMRLIPKFLI
jgi:hypothetical protein